MANQIAVIIDARLHNELVLRTRKADDVTRYIEHAIETFLERTAQDDMWNRDYLDEFADAEVINEREKYGDPKKGYQWQILFLPNGTNLFIRYKGKKYSADIRHGSLTYNDRPYSPSEWARLVANNTSRNAWNDIWVLRPGSDSWELAAALRHSLQESQS